jgi:hypothetical protein
MNISMIMSGIDPHRGATPCDNAALRHCAAAGRDGSSRND